MRWRQTNADDLVVIQNIASLVHPQLLEGPKVFAEKLGIFPEGCFVLESITTIMGYAFVHPWRLNDIPKLNELLLRLPSEPDCLLIHDVAILEQARGRGAAGELVGRVATLAKDRNLPHLALVSVYGSQHLWARLGFDLISSKEVADRLSCYGATARYMVRSLK